MSRIPADEKRVLTTDPIHRGFGYVIFEGPEQLIDWGVRHVDGQKNKASIAAAGEFISRYRPNILVVEDVATKGSRRCRRVRELVEALDRFGRERGLTVRKISQAKVKRAFSPSGIRNRIRLRDSSPCSFPNSRATFRPSASPG